MDWVSEGEESASRLLGLSGGKRWDLVTGRPLRSDLDRRTIDSILVYVPLDSLLQSFGIEDPQVLSPDAFDDANSLPPAEQIRAQLAHHAAEIKAEAAAESAPTASTEPTSAT